jgi:hypothetical protein
MGRASRTNGEKNAYRILQKLEGRHSRRLENNIKIDLRGEVVWNGLIWLRLETSRGLL